MSAVVDVRWIQEAGKPATKGNFTVRNYENGELVTIELPVTQQQYNNWVSGMVIQKAMPNLSRDQREALITGILPGRFTEVMGPEE